MSHDECHWMMDSRAALEWAPMGRVELKMHSARCLALSADASCLNLTTLICAFAGSGPPSYRSFRVPESHCRNSPYRSPTYKCCSIIFMYNL